MQAIGLRLEENGTVLALWGGTGSGQTAPQVVGKWDRVPDNILQRLDTAAKVWAASFWRHTSVFRVPRAS